MTSSNPPPIRTPWYTPSAAKYLVFVLAGVTFLFASERFQWFAFNRHKGYTVVLGVGFVSLAMTAMLLAGVAGFLLGRRFRFGLATMFLLVGVLGVTCGWFARELHLARTLQQSRSRFAAKDLRGAAGPYIKEGDPGIEALPKTLRMKLAEVLGDEFFDDVEYANVTKPESLSILIEFPHLKSLDVLGTQIEDDDLEPIERLPQLRSLVFRDIGLTDRGLAHVRGLTGLTTLYLDESAVGDDGLASLQALSQLRDLYLRSTRITDQGLEHLRGLKSLEGVILDGTEVSDAGLPYLQELPRLERLYLQSTAITDNGLQSVSRMTELRVLYLSRTKITDDGLRHLQHLPRLEILGLDATPITDEAVPHLAKMKSLKAIHLNGTNITQAGKERLQSALPGCFLDL